MRLDYMEIELSEFCNLNCACCCNFTNLAKEKRFYEFGEFKKDLERISEIFTGVDKLRLMGGEPFLNPRISDYARLAAELFPDSDLRIVTNGLLIPKTDPSVLRELAQTGAFLDISAYPPTRKLKKQIREKLDASGLGFNMGPPIRVFLKPLLDKPFDTPDRSFNNCIFSRCHTLGHGKLTPCSFAYCAPRINGEYGVRYPEDDYIDIYSDVTAEEIIDRFSRPHEFCRYCAPAPVPVRWRGGAVGSRAELSDWTVKRDSPAVRLLAALQSAAKKPEAMLRETVQKRR